ncbi:hypothetical protein [Alkaliphilus crotonatoxidans]
MEAINYNGLIEAVGACCLTETQCGSCENEACLVGYCKQALVTALKSQEEFLDGGMEDIPYEDSKLFDEEEIIRAIAFTLNQCRNCRVYHDEDCIINIIRSSLEVALIGDSLEYKGSNLVYISELEKKNKEIAQRVFQQFKQAGRN